MAPVLRTVLTCLLQFGFSRSAMRLRDVSGAPACAHPSTTPSQTLSITAAQPLGRHAGYAQPSVLRCCCLPSDHCTQRPLPLRFPGRSPGLRGLGTGAQSVKPPRGSSAFQAHDRLQYIEPPGPHRVASPRQGALPLQVRFAVCLADVKVKETLSKQNHSAARTTGLPTNTGLQYYSLTFTDYCRVKDTCITSAALHGAEWLLEDIEP
ncbi:hypothetical protein NDU88_000623 [Pleurodeles waltl]|uniref:Uncharacterized protein n=1 Tax=Pleurodeles waltl TaxID=8319 RepID=A0AAV7U619_PLEWA|nr:hypothetical protein NDU88_000623 [Pleurodeles waltl]